MKAVNQIIREELESLLENKRAIKQIINSDAAYAILDNTKGCTDCTWCAGGCAILAYALQIAYGYQIYVIYNHDDKQVEHFMVMTPNNNYIDCDGEQRDIVKNFRRKDFYMHPEKKLQILPYTNDLNITDIIIDMNASKQLASLIKPELNEEQEIKNVVDGIWYHGSNKPVEKFLFSLIGKNSDKITNYHGYGIYFIDDIERAKKYGNVVRMKSKPNIFWVKETGPLI